MTPNELTAILAVLKGNYNHRFDVTPATEKSWQLIVGDLDYRAVNDVISAWMMTEEWPPVPASIRKQVHNVLSPLPSASDAWLMVMGRIRSTYPGFPAPDWDAPQIVQDSLKDIGGTWAVRQTDDTSRMEQKFRTAYNERRDSAQRNRSLASGMKELTM